MQIEIINVEEDMAGERLDTFIVSELEILSRVEVQELITDSLVTVDGISRKASYRIKVGEEVKVTIPKTEEIIIRPQNIPLNIVYEDEDVLIVDKPKDMVVHPSIGNYEGTLVNALLYYTNDLSDINGELRPGIVHRLDKDTSGLLVVAKNNNAHTSIAGQIKANTVKREYMALVHGIIKENLGLIEAPIGRDKTNRKKMAVVAGGKPSITNYQVLERFDNYSLVRASLVTGRTHQIRVHFAYIKHAIVGDQLYGSSRKHFDLASQVLHAETLGFIHPRSNQYIEFSSQLPRYMEDILQDLRKF